MPDSGNYPKDIETIIVNKCAVSGCHNSLSYTNAASLNLTSWNDLFKGSLTGSVIIPYRPDFSSLCFFTNTDSSLGITLQPTMPFNSPPLSKGEYLKLRDWITAGAPNAAGQVKFADDASRKKFYITNRLCNVVAVIDAVSLLQMNYVDVGNKGVAEFPYCIKVAPDRKYWYVSFFSQSDFVQQFSAVDDKYIGAIHLGVGVWTSFALSADSKYGWFVDNSSAGKIVYVDLESRVVLSTYTFGGNFKYPIGIALNERLKKLYVGALTGNYLYNIDVTDPLVPVIHEMPIDGTGTIKYQSVQDPQEFIVDPSGNRCYIACGASAEIRVFDMEHDSLVCIVPLGAHPAFAGFSAATQKLFISCPDDTASFPGNRGSVIIVDAQTNKVVKKLNTGYQPYGIAVHDDIRRVAVVNANISSAGPESHHVSGCGKKNGNITFIDMNTLELVQAKKLEVAVFPFGAAAR